MSRMTLNAKSQRVLRFLTGTRHPSICQALQPYGFDQAQLERGWALLRQASELRGAYQPIAPKDATLVNNCDAWRVRWFTVAQSALRKYPLVEAWLFSGLQPSHGEASTVTVPLFVKRVRSMTVEPAPIADAKPARQLLAKRGLTDAVLAAVDPWVEGLAQFAGEEPPPVVTEDEETAAQDAMWDWYLEWSGIARAAIESRAMLRELGFGRSHRNSATAETDGVEPTPTKAREKAAKNSNDPEAA